MSTGAANGELRFSSSGRGRRLSGRYPGHGLRSAWRILPRLTVVLLMLATAACGDGETRICFGTDGFCGGLFGRNLPPQADAGADIQVTSGTLVELDGSGSRDPDGHITAYAWTQESGPAVAIDQATAPVASFDAPIVQAPAVLGFRLLVTDNRGASDVDRVRVTVVPGEVGALHRGLTLLKDTLRPSPDTVSGTCADCQGYLALWLGARVEAAASEQDPDIDPLLDELRVIMMERAAHDGQLAARRFAPAPQRRLLHLAGRAVAAFTMERDPATSELASRGTPQPAPSAAVPPPAWAAAIAAALPDLAGERATLAELRRASTSLLLGDADALPAPRVAAATLVLALPAGAIDGAAAEAAGPPD